VEHLYIFTPLRARHAVAHHVQTKGAGRGHGARAGRKRFLRTQMGDALRRCLLKPHSTSARTAAESLFPTARHCAILRVVSSADDCSCRIHFPVDARQVTRVVQSDRLAVTAVVAQPSRPDQFCEQRRVMLHLVLPTELRVFILERVVTMWARRHDLLYLATAKGLDIDLRALLEEKFVADAARGIARATLLFAEHREIHSCFLE